MTERSCANCGSLINECMGFVKAGDIMSGRLPIRELCGKCALVVEWDKNDHLVRQTLDHRAS